MFSHPHKQATKENVEGERVYCKESFAEQGTCMSVDENGQARVESDNGQIYRLPVDKLMIIEPYA